MALRIGGGKALPMAEEPMVEQEAPVEEPMPVEEDLMAELPEALEEEPAVEEPMSTGHVDMLTAGYLGPEDGPFICGNCTFFNGPNSCQIVAGDIDPEGCCNLFTNANAGAAEQEEMPMDEPMPEEAPVEEAVEPEVEEASEEGY
jgi:hypothetical protein